MLLRPRTTACAPAVGTVADRAARGPPAACRRRTRALLDEQPDVLRMEAVHVLERVDRSMTARSSMRSGSGNCTRMPCTAGSSLSRSIEVEQLGLARLGGKAQQLAVIPAARTPFACCGRRPGWPGYRPRAQPSDRARSRFRPGPGQHRQPTLRGSAGPGLSHQRSDAGTAVFLKRDQADGGHKMFRDNASDSSRAVEDQIAVTTPVRALV